MIVRNVHLIIKRGLLFDVIKILMQMQGDLFFQNSQLLTYLFSMKIRK